VQKRGGDLKHTAPAKTRLFVSAGFIGAAGFEGRNLTLWLSYKQIAARVIFGEPVWAMLSIKGHNVRVYPARNVGFRLMTCKGQAGFLGEFKPIKRALAH
jgi:hypothetical protein